MMTLQTIRLNLSDTLLQRLTDAADAAQQSLDEVLLQTIRAGLPPDLARLPERFRADLRLLNRLDDDMLRQVAGSQLDADKAAEYEALLAQNQNATLNESGQARLAALREQADLLMFRRAYALALLKWRGVSVPAAGLINDQVYHPA
jgi:hypothetical protein